MKASEAIQRMIDDAEDVGHVGDWDRGWRLGARQAKEWAMLAETGRTDQGFVSTPESKGPLVKDMLQIVDSLGNQILNLPQSPAELVEKVELTRKHVAAISKAIAKDTPNLRIELVE